MGSESLVPAVVRYAERFHAALGAGHQVASPLGAWLVLALCGSALDAGEDPARKPLADILGLDPAEAFALAEALLAAPHPAVASAAAVWSSPLLSPGSLVAWRDGLPAVVETGDLPDQDALDRWADEHTLGLIKSFPAELDPATVVLLATALATRIAWKVPFDVAPAAALGGPWAAGLSRVLHTPSKGHVSAIVSTKRAGDVGVHTAYAETGLRVTSVVANPDVPATDVLAAAHELATAERFDHRSLFTLPLGEQPLWTITEERAETKALDGREERIAAVLPAWSARANHDLSDPAFGFHAGAAALSRMIPGGTDVDARQAVVARYHQAGFEAAAVTGMAVLTSYIEPRDGVIRTAELRFAHPYAVVAVAADDHWTGGRRVRGPWNGVPVFSAWVANPDDTDPDRIDPDRTDSDDASA
jgi:hypothetical protein